MNPLRAERFALLLLILLAFARLAWGLDGKALWWDESLTLQRAESPWTALLRGTLWIDDGVHRAPTTDQHPPLYFVLAGALVRLAGTSEFVLRWPAVLAATLFVPALWALARHLVRRGVLPTRTPIWSALLASLSPFLLWYGQEARPYALWATLTVVSTHLLLRATSDQPFPTKESRGKERHTVNNEPVPPLEARRLEEGFLWFIYALSLLLLLATHYYAIFLLPVHALWIFLWLLPRRRALAVASAGGVLLAGGAIGFAVAQRILRDGGGGNFASVSLPVLSRDLLNAFSLGLSVDVSRVFWLDLVFLAVALAGVAWALRSWRALRAGGWLALALVLVPVGMLLVVLRFYDAYMNARHMSLLAGGWLLLVGAGLAAIGHRQRFVAAALGTLLAGGMIASSVNYFTLERYDKGAEWAPLTEHLRTHLLPGDRVLLNPPYSWRIFDYYLPIDELERQGASLEAIGVPQLRPLGERVVAAAGWPQTEAALAALADTPGRVWHVSLGDHPHMDPDDRVEAWLAAHFFELDRRQYRSGSSLHADLYTPTPPVYSEPISIGREMDGESLDIDFGGRMKLVATEVAPPLTTTSALPVTLAWQITERQGAQPDARIKYILRLEERLTDGTVRTLAQSEREPFGGWPTISMNLWRPTQTIVEQSALPLVALPGGPSADWATVDWANASLAVELYDASTLERLPVMHAVHTTGGTKSLEVFDTTVLLPLATQPVAQEEEAL